MKKFLYVFVLLFAVQVTAQHVFEITYRHVAPENQEAFEEKEMKYWAQVAKAGVDEGKLVTWIFLKRVDTGFGVFGPDEPNYAFVNVYQNIEQLTTSTSVWQNADKVLGMDASLVATGSISKNIMLQRYLTAGSLGGSAGNYCIWNYAKPVDSQGFLEENLSLWKPYFEKNMESKGMVSWGIASRIYPLGHDQSTFITWDNFETLDDAYKHLMPSQGMGEVAKKSKMDKYMPDGFRYRVLFQVLKQVY